MSGLLVSFNLQPCRCEITRRVRSLTFMKPPFAFFLLVGLFLTCGSAAVHAQAGPEKGGRELQIWTGGGHSVRGIASDIWGWTARGRYGWVLTNRRGPRLL